MKTGVIKVSVLYPNGKDFDMDYYIHKHRAGHSGE